MFKHQIEVVWRDAQHAGQMAHTAIVHTWTFLGVCWRRREDFLHL